MKDAPAQPTNIAIEQQLRQMNDEWVKALVWRDSARLERIMADDFVFTYPMEGDDKTQFIDDLVSGDLNVQQLTQANLTVRIWGHTAILSALDTVQWFYKGRDFSGKYKIAQVYANRDDQWRLVSVQACPIT
jgi:ketosteroid isomerase-like protein